MTGNIIEVFNHAPFALTAVKDGREYTLRPGFSHITADVFRYAKTQNIVPGTEDATNPGRYESLVSFVKPDLTAEQRADFTTWPAELLAGLKGTERIDRSTLMPDRQGKHAQALGTPFPRGRVGMDGATAGMVDPGRFGGD